MDKIQVLDGRSGLRDMALVREVLLWAEGGARAEDFPAGERREEIALCVRHLIVSGYLSGMETVQWRTERAVNGSFTFEGWQGMLRVDAVTHEGYELLDTLRHGDTLAGLRAFAEAHQLPFGLSALPRLVQMYLDARRQQPNG